MSFDGQGAVGLAAKNLEKLGLRGFSLDFVNSSLAVSRNIKAIAKHKNSDFQIIPNFSLGGMWEIKGLRREKGKKLEFLTPPL